jgi:hypothetical protein
MYGGTFSNDRYAKAAGKSVLDRAFYVSVVAREKRED